MADMSPYQNFIAVSRYSRWLEDEQRRETWKESTDRYFDFMSAHLKDNYSYDSSGDGGFIRDKFLNLEAFGSMRALMTAGPALERSHIAAYNCAYLPIDNPVAFDELLYILMNGTGVGFSVEKKYVDQLPEVRKCDPSFWYSPVDVYVEDSKEGWAEALRAVLTALYEGREVSWDVSAVRSAGSRLKTFGGRSSGPEPLEELFEFISRVFRTAQGRRLTTLEVFDIVCKIASVVVVGGVRRSALIALTDLGDKDLATAKSGHWWETSPHRALANISAVYEERPSLPVFLEEWKTIYESCSGERGIFNREASRNQAAKYGRRSAYIEYGTNPCCISSDSWLMTADGPKQIKELKEQPFKAVVNGIEYDAPRGSWISGTTDVYRLRTKAGYYLDLTKEHQILCADGSWRQAKDLYLGEKIVIHDHGTDLFWGRSDNFGDGYLLGLLVGDGNFTKGVSENSRHRGEVKVWKSEEGIDPVMEKAYLFAKNLPHRKDWSGWCVGVNPYNCMNIGNLPEKYDIKPTSKHSIEHLESESSEFYKGFLSGIFDSDGHVEGYNNDKGISVRLAQSNIELLYTVQRMLLRLGMKSRIYTQKDAVTSMLPDGRGGVAEYVTKPCWRLVISGNDARIFADRVGFINDSKQSRLRHYLDTHHTYNKKFTTEIESFVYLMQQEVWDAEVSGVHAFDANGIYAHNSEIILRPYQFCNLSTVIVRPEDGLVELVEKVKAATIMGTWQATLTDFKYLRPVWKENTEEERLLGVSMTGQLGHPVLNGSEGKEKLETWLAILRNVAIGVNETVAEDIGISPSAAITCVKPEGTTSQLTNTASGMHPWHSDYYRRNVRADKKDPLTRLMADAGVPYEDDIVNPSVVVFGFPVKAPEAAVTRSDLAAVEHLELWLTYQRYWTEHKPSVTISVREEEWLPVAAWVWEHFDEISGVAFLPYADHAYKQAPYEELTEEEYNSLVGSMPEDIHWESLSWYEKYDQTVGSQSLACSADGQGCETVDLI